MAEVDGDSANIEYGPCQVLFNLIDLGYFKGDVTLTYTIEYLDIEVAQSSMLCEPRIKTERCVVTVPMSETNLAKLTTVMPTGTYTGAGTPKKIEFGGGQVSSSNLKELVIKPITDGSGTVSTNENEWTIIYKTFPKPTFTKTYNREGERVVTVEFHAYRDSTKDPHKQLFVLGDVDAT